MTDINMLPDLITFEEVAQYLEVDVETARLYARRPNNPLPVIMISPKTIRINKQYFLEWIESNKKEVNK